jgi:hypothetical protein
MRRRVVKGPAPPILPQGEGNGEDWSEDYGRVNHPPNKIVLQE